MADLTDKERDARNKFLDHVADLLKQQNAIMAEALTPQSAEAREENLAPMTVSFTARYTYTARPKQ